MILRGKDEEDENVLINIKNCEKVNDDDVTAIATGQ